MTSSNVIQRPSDIKTSVEKQEACKTDGEGDRVCETEHGGKKSFGI